MLITTNQINLIRENKHNDQFNKSKKPVKQLLDDNFKTVKYRQAEELKAEIRSFMKSNRASTDLCENLIVMIEKSQGVIYNEKI